MQQEPAPPRSPAPGQDPAPSGAPSMPPPEPASEGHQPSPSRSPAEQALEEEFQFLCCQSCQAEAKCPKLLPCLHTLCSGCLEASGLRCSICQVPGPLGAGSPALDNVFFESLQRRLSVYRQIVDAQAVCTRCKEPADFWCFECEQLLCAKCFEAHQWFLKHEARPLAELRSQSVCEFLDSTRKSNSIFCSNPNHRTPMLTSIYCRGCSKPLCCSCALLDSSHGELKCDISAEIQQRQEELDTMARVLQEQDGAFGAAHAQMHSAVSQLGRARADTEALIHARVRQLVEHVLAREQELLAGVTARYQRCYEELAGRMGRLEAVLQRIRTGSALVRRMKLYASDQEVLDMHGFLRDALHRLRQEEPHDLHTAVRTDGFEEFKVRLQELVSCITRGTDLAVPRRASPDAAGTPRDSLDVDQTPPPEEMLGSPAQAPQLTETHTGALVQSVPGVHPVPVHAYSIRDPSCREEVCNKVTPQKRKSCQTECPRKAIKMESEEERETRLAQSSPEQPRPSTSKAVSPPLDGPSSPESPIMGNEVFLPNSNHSTGDPGEAAATRGERGHPRFARGGSEDGYKLLRDVLGFQCEEARGSVAPSPDTHKGASVEERVVVISSSEDSDAENSVSGPEVRPRTPASPHSRSQGTQPQQCTESTETATPHASPAHPLPRAQGAFRLCWASRLPHGACRPPARSSHHPAAVSEADSPSQPARHQEEAAVRPRRGTGPLSRRVQRTTRLGRIFRLPLKVYCKPMWTYPAPAVQATTPAATGPPGHPVGAREGPCFFQRAMGHRRRARGAVRSLGCSLRGSPNIAQWLNNFFALPFSAVAAQLDTSLNSGNEGGQSAPDS
ncbi:protein PML isoform X3 [Canis lupus familiaris]|uniref:protein PML isoform X3 n=1 Tax=Canis lupus familiaris TaxID=9615 RepID=UPI0018F7DC04|nr:protein PML isoform X3 [Canis lupus familiaris]